MNCQKSHEGLYKHLISKGNSTHKPTVRKKNREIDKRYVCLTGIESQFVGNRGKDLSCFILYGPNMNYEGEQGDVHCRKEFWDDIGKRRKKGVRFHEDVYELLVQVKSLLAPILQTRSPDWVCCEVTNWPKFCQIVRQHNSNKYSVKQVVSELRRIADCLENGKPFKIQIAGERITVPTRAIFNIEHEREGNSEKVEFQFKW